MENASSSRFLEPDIDDDDGVAVLAILVVVNGETWYRIGYCCYAAASVTVVIPWRFGKRGLQLRSTRRCDRRRRALGLVAGPINPGILGVLNDVFDQASDDEW